METTKKLEINNYTKVMLPAINYDFASDSRLLIPFIEGDKIGFINKDGIVVVKPQYNMYHGECYNSEDTIKVGVQYHRGYARNNGKVEIYSRPLYGLINCEGELILPIEYLWIWPAIGNKNLFTVQRKDYSWGVITADGEEIVPFGKYEWIDGFDKGYARVKNGKQSSNLKDNDNKWGLINEIGEEVLPAEYDSIWNFYNKDWDNTIIVKSAVSTKFFFNKRGL